MAQPANPERVRAWLAQGSSRGAPPADVQWLGDHGLVLAEKPLPSAQLEELGRDLEAVRAWLAHEFGYRTFPLIQVEITPGSSWVPRALLYPDGLVNRLIVSDAGIARDLIVHELTHALSNVRDTWGGELLAYHAGFSGAGALATRFDEAQGELGISADDVLLDGLQSWRLFSPRGLGPRTVAYEPAHPYAGFSLDATYRWLGRQRGGAARAEYFAALRELPEGDGSGSCFVRHFGLTREAAIDEVLSALGSAPKRVSDVKTNHGEATSDVAGFDGASVDEAILRRGSQLGRRWWTDVFELVYLRAALSRRSEPPDPALTLYLDYRIYRAQGHAGAVNEALRRDLLRRSRACSERDGSSLAVRYYLLTDHALAQYRGRMANLPALDAELARTLRAAALRLEEHVSNPVARTAWGHFHLFHPAELGAERALGESLLSGVVDEDASWEEAYLFLATSFAGRGDRSNLEYWLDRYAAAVGGVGARLARGMLDTRRSEA